MATIRQAANMNWWALRLALASLVVGVTVIHAQQQTTSMRFSAAVETIARSMAYDAPVLRRVYARTAYRPLWIAGDRPTPQALAAVAFIDSVAQRGLRATDYDVDAMHARLATLPSVDALQASDSLRLAAIDVALSRSIIHLVVALERGRVDPATVRVEMPLREGRDVAAFVVEASRADDVARILASVEPPYAGYAALVRMLARYRTLAEDSSLSLPPDEKTVRPNEIYPDAPRLRRLLTALGDLSPNAAYSEPNRYAGALVLAVIHFQRRHGLAADGTIGGATRAALRVPFRQRVRQIELALERWRWLPSRAPVRYVVVNIPAFRLYAFENDSTAQQPTLSMNVIVGEAERHRDTPAFVSEMREVVFRPYWDIPPRIARTELVPAIERGGIDMASAGYEIVGPGESPYVYQATRANLERVAAGSLRLRQRPGDGNALGLVKFVFPNSHNVYLHGTPARELFAFARRDFSHGCIRAEEPAALAHFVLGADSAWNRHAIEGAMDGTVTLHVPLPQPIAVFILYMTAVVAPDGSLYFYRDVYGGDAKLDRVLRAQPND